MQDPVQGYLYKIFIEDLHRKSLFGSRKASVRLYRFVSVRGNFKLGRFGSCIGRFVLVRVTWRFGSVRFVVCSVAGREVFDRMGVDEYQIVILSCSRGILFSNVFDFFVAVGVGEGGVEV